MKKTNKILGGLLTVLLVGTFAMNGVKAEKLVDTGTANKDVTLVEITSNGIYDIDIEWGGLTYNYMNTENGYVWSNIGQENNTVYVTNNSVNSVVASLSFTPNIEGVYLSKTEHYEETEGKNNCVEVSSGGYAWDGGYTLPENKNNVLYTDAACNNVVNVGAAYDYGKTYYRTNPVYTTLQNENSVKLNGIVNSDTANFEVVGSAFNNTNLRTKTTFYISLAGGRIEDVRAALDRGDTKIGTITVSITNGAL